MVTIGTGLGSALFYDGELIPNFELGHLITRMEGNRAMLIQQEKKDSLEDWGRPNKFLKHVERIITPDFIILGGGVSKHITSTVIKSRSKLLMVSSANNSGIIGACYTQSTKQRLPSSSSSSLIGPVLLICSNSFPCIEITLNSVL